MVPLHRDEPRILGPLPGPRSAAWLERDQRVMSPSYTRVYPLVVRRARGAMVEDMDGNRFLDFTAGIAVTNVGHSHPRVVAAIQSQSRRLIHMSGTDFYYAPQVRLAERLAALAPGTDAKAGLLHQQRCRGDRGRAQAGAAAHRTEPRPVVSGRVSRANLRGDVAFRLQADAAAGLLTPGAGDPPCSLRRSRERARPAANGLPARRAGGDLRRADPGRGGLHRSAPRIPAGSAQALRRAQESCWCSTRCRAESAGPARCSPPSTGGSTETSSAWPRESPMACRWGRSWRGRR